MNNLYEQNVIEIKSLADSQLLKLNERKFYSRNDIDELSRLWMYRCIVVGGFCVLVTVIVLHFCK